MTPTLTLIAVAVAYVAALIAFISLVHRHELRVHALAAHQRGEGERGNFDQSNHNEAFR